MPAIAPLVYPEGVSAVDHITQKAQQAEANMATAIRRTAGILDTIGTDKIDDALAVLEASATGAHARLRMAGARTMAIVAGVADLADMIAGEILAGLLEDREPVMLPLAPLPDVLPEQVAVAACEPVDQEQELKTARRKKR